MHQVRCMAPSPRMQLPPRMHALTLPTVLAMSGIGMVIGGLPSGWILDNCNGHAVLIVSHLVQVSEA